MLLSTISTELSQLRICANLDLEQTSHPIIDIVQAPGDIDEHLRARPIDEADNEADSSAAA